jgi:hypothetical protein
MAGTKLSSNLQSQNIREPTLFVLRLREPRFRRGQQRSEGKKAVNREKRFFLKKFKYFAEMGVLEKRMPPRRLANRHEFYQCEQP